MAILQGGALLVVFIVDLVEARTCSKPWILIVGKAGGATPCPVA